MMIAAAWIGVLGWTRFFNLERTARFIWDESSDLVRMHQMYVDRKLTLVGPISEDNLKVFSSLTYFMYMPATVMARFSPVGSATASAMWGVVTVLLGAIWVFQINRKNLVWLAAALTVGIPFVETSRWAWNPNQILLWIFLAGVGFAHNKFWTMVVAGMSLGLAVHQHYWAIWASITAVVVMAGAKWPRDKWKAIGLAAGFVAALLPFVIFDLRHPPGLFLSYAISGAGEQAAGVGAWSWGAMWAGWNRLGEYLAGPAGAGLLGIGLVLTVALDLGGRAWSRLKWVLPAAAQVVACGWLKGLSSHYLLPAVGFVMLWLALPRSGWGKVVSRGVLGVIIIAGLAALPTQLTKISWESDMKTTGEVAEFIERVGDKLGWGKTNMAVLASRDPNTYGRRYRDLLLLKNKTLADKHEYERSEYLVVVSASDLETVRKDAAAELRWFRDGDLIESKYWPNWRVYVLARN